VVGTSCHNIGAAVTYFYRRAVQRGDSVDAGQFRYDGPRPQSKEAAIVMLADSCEAVVRARQDRTRPNIDELVDGVFAERLAEGQLDECDVTMRELQQIAASFKTTLRAVYHPRIEYPSPGPEEMAQFARS
jgi:membrane-associated HD superfamily phosphohydrolase